MGHGGHFPSSAFQQRAAADMAAGVKQPERTIQSDDILLYLTAILGITLPGLVFMCYSAAFRWLGCRFGGGIVRQPVQPDPSTDHEDDATTKDSVVTSEVADVRTVVILYATETGTSKGLAMALAQSLLKSYKVYVTDLGTITVEDLVELDVTMVVFIVSTWIDGSAPTACAPFLHQLSLIARNTPAPLLTSLHYCMFAVGNAMYETGYNAFGRRLDRLLVQIDARPFMTLALGDESKAESIAHQFGVWQCNVLTMADDDRRVRQAAAALHKRRMAVIEEELRAGSSDESTGTASSANITRRRPRRRRVAKGSPSDDE